MTGQPTSIRQPAAASNDSARDRRTGAALNSMLDLDRLAYFSALQASVHTCACSLCGVTGAQSQISTRIRCRCAVADCARVQHAGLMRPHLHTRSSTISKFRIKLKRPGLLRP